MTVSPWNQSNIVLLFVFPATTSISNSNTKFPTTFPSTSASTPSCIITCCQNCTGAICSVCYKKYSNRPDICPCVPSSTTRSQPKPKQRAETTPTSTNLERAVMMDKDPLNKSSKQSTSPVRVPICRPSCCPRANCTKFSCPSCYRRFAKNAASCPCVNTG